MTSVHLRLIFQQGSVFSIPLLSLFLFRTTTKCRHIRLHDEPLYSILEVVLGVVVLFLAFKTKSQATEE